MVIIILVTVFILWLLSEFQQFSYKGIPWASGWLPFVGHFLQFVKGPEQYVELQHKRFNGKPYVLQLFGNRTVQLSSTSDIELHSKLSAASGSLIESQPSFKVVFPPETLVENPPHVRVIKSKFTPARFSFVPRINKAVHNVCGQVLQDKTTLENVFDFIQRIVGEAALGSMVGDKYDPMLYNVSLKMVKATDFILKMGSFGCPVFILRMIKFWKLSPCWEKIEELIKPLIQERRNSPSPEISDFVTMMLETFPEITDKAMGEFVSAFIFVSFSTTRDALAHTLICLSSRPSLMERVRAEAMENVNENMELTPESVKNMKLAEACVLEAIRVSIFPISNAMRKALVDIEYGDTIIRKGTVFACDGYISKNDEIFPNAREYDPDRWLTKRPNASHFLGFGSNVHMCPGRFFSLTESQSILALLLCKYNIESVNGVIVNEFTALNKNPDYAIRFTKREKSEQVL